MDKERREEVRKASERICDLRCSFNDVALVKNGLHEALDCLEAQDKRIQAIERAAWRYIEIVCEGMDGRPTANDLEQFIAVLKVKEES